VLEGVSLHLAALLALQTKQQLIISNKEVMSLSLWVCLWHLQLGATALKTWNSLPPAVWIYILPDTFCHHLKTHYF